MYSKTSERGNYLKRVASHATKPHPNGRIDIIPPGAEKEPGNTLLQELQLLLQNPFSKRGSIRKLREAIVRGDTEDVERRMRYWFDEKIARMRIQQVSEARIKKYGKKPKSGWPKSAPSLRKHKVVHGF